jgi:hypothetical protein
VLVALDGIDFVDGQIELKGQTINGLTGGPDQLELGVAEASGRDAELGIKVVAAIGLTDAAQSVAAANAVAVAAIVQGGA